MPSKTSPNDSNNVVELQQYSSSRQTVNDPSFWLKPSPKWLDLDGKNHNSAVSIQKWYHTSSTRLINLWLAKAFIYGIRQRHGTVYSQVCLTVIKAEQLSFCFWLDFSQ